MKRVAIAVVLFALPVVAQETAPAASNDPLAAVAQPKAKPDIVAVARAARAKKAASKSKVITNADVRKAKSTLKVHPLSDADAPQPAAKPRATQAGEEEHYRARKAAQERVALAETRVTDLEHELDRAEQSYYNENDPTYRDDVLRKRFDQTKRQLEAARKELADARDALAAVVVPRS